MDHNYDLLGQLRTQWQRIGRTPHARACAREFVLRHPHLALSGVEDLVELVLALEPRGGRSVEQRAAIVQALLVDAGDPLIHRTLLQTLLPGIVSVCRQLQFGRGIVGEASEALDEAISLASELLVDWSGQSRQYAAPDLLSALRGRLRRWLLKEKAARAQTVEHPALESAGDVPSTLLARLAAHQGGPHDRLARLTYARVFEGRALKDLAAADRSSPQSLQNELRQFATRFLL